MRLLYVAPERFSSPGFVQRIGRGVDRPVRRRRGALRLAVGARLPARLLPPRRRRPPPGRRRDRGLDRHGHAAGGVRHRAAAVAARAGAGRHGIRPAEPRVRRGAAGAAREAAADRGRAAARARTRCRRSSTRVRARGRRSCATSCERSSAVPRSRCTTPVSGARRPRRRPAPLPRRRRAGDRGDQRVRHGRRQAERAHGDPRERASLARGVLPGGRPRRARRRARRGRCCSRRTGTRRCTCTSSSATRSTRSCRRASLPSSRSAPTTAACPGMGPARYNLDARRARPRGRRQRRAAALADRPPVTRGGHRADAVVA